ncbi:hypothetical protein [Aeromicrobium sp. UC242_57]|uniref:hypothetical protein n=1 Tax=Aeromicrobium sp. UC242_57 TaxID=3374624 RepID=UPI0037972FF3
MSIRAEAVRPPQQVSSEAHRGLVRTRTLRTTGLAIAVGVLVLTAIASIMIGARGLSAGTVLGALSGSDGSTEHLIIWGAADSSDGRGPRRRPGSRALRRAHPGIHPQSAR